MLDKKIPFWFWIILPIALIFGGFFVWTTSHNYLYGDYRIDSYWLNSSYEGIKYCDNCLWIRFDEGCNHYKVFYFENQHEQDKRLKIGMPVNINFRSDGTIRNVEPTWKYNYKCS